MKAVYEFIEELTDAMFNVLLLFLSTLVILGVIVSWYRGEAQKILTGEPFTGVFIMWLMVSLTKGILYAISRLRKNAEEEDDDGEVTTEDGFTVNMVDWTHPVIFTILVGTFALMCYIFLVSLN